MLRSRAAIVVPNGNSIELNINWTNMSGVPESPTRVTYQIFDMHTDDAVSDEVEVSGLAAEMSFVVGGADLINESQADRHLVIQVRAEYEIPTDTHTELIEVIVKRGYS